MKGTENLTIEQLRLRLNRLRRLDGLSLSLEGQLETTAGRVCTSLVPRLLLMNFDDLRLERLDARNDRLDLSCRQAVGRRTLLGRRDLSRRTRPKGSVHALIPTRKAMQ